MSTNPTGLTSNIARQVAQVKANNANQNNSPVNSGPRVDAFSKATAPTNSAPVTTAVAAPGSAPAAPIGGTTAPTSPAAAARTAPNVAAAMPISAFPGAMAALASAAVVTSGVGESKDKNKDDTNKAINRATDVGDKSGLALQGDNSAAGEEAAKTGSTGGASGPGAAAA